MREKRSPRVGPKDLAFMYLAAKEQVIGAGFAGEIDWQYDVSVEHLTEQLFLREAAWVVLSSGFRESVLRTKFEAISNAFLRWESCEEVLGNRAICRSNALEVFNHQQKIDAILNITKKVASWGISNVRDRLNAEGVTFLRELPFMGPVTSIHLAKNLGFSLVKPDRHLVRLAKRTGYQSPEEMCEVIARLIGEPLSVIDIVFWRHATLDTINVTD